MIEYQYYFYKQFSDIIFGDNRIIRNFIKFVVKKVRITIMTKDFKIRATFLM